MASTTNHSGDSAGGGARSAAPAGASGGDALTGAPAGTLPPVSGPFGAAPPSRPPQGHGRRPGMLWALAGAVFIVVVWEVLSLLVSPTFVASPADTVKALGRLAWGRTLWIQLLITLMRLVVGLGIGAAIGLVFGVLAGLNARLRSFFEAIRWVGMTIPVIIIVILAMLWFGLGDLTVILAVGLIVIPTVYINTVAGILSVDTRLVEMGRVYRFSRRLMLTEIYAPAIASPVMAGLTLATGVGVRAVVLTEVMAAMSGIGHAFTRAWVNLETAEMFAWVVVVLALMAIIEFAVLRPLKRRVMRWRKAPQ